MTVDGKTHQVRSVYSPSQEVLGPWSRPEVTQAVFAAIRKATDQLVASLRAS